MQTYFLTLLKSDVKINHIGELKIKVVAELCSFGGTSGESIHFLTFSATL
jgi:hypothetical protein